MLLLLDTKQISRCSVGIVESWVQEYYPGKRNFGLFFFFAKEETKLNVRFIEDDWLPFWRLPKDLIVLWLCLACTFFFCFFFESAISSLDFERPFYWTEAVNSPINSFHPNISMLDERREQSCASWNIRWFLFSLEITVNSPQTSGDTIHQRGTSNGMKLSQLVSTSSKIVHLLLSTFHPKDLFRPRFRA